MPSGITQKSSGEDSGPGASHQYSVIRVEVNTELQERRGRSLNLHRNGKRGKPESLVVKDEHLARGPAYAKIKKG